MYKRRNGNYCLFWSAADRNLLLHLGTEIFETKKCSKIVNRKNLKNIEIENIFQNLRNRNKKNLENRNFETSLLKYYFLRFFSKIYYFFRVKEIKNVKTCVFNVLINFSVTIQFLNEKLVKKHQIDIILNIKNLKNTISFQSSLSIRTW